MTSNRATTPNFEQSIDVNSVKFKLQDIQNVVSDFYGKVATDPLLKVPFSTVHDWPHHIDRLTHFWWWRLGGEPYMEMSYNPVEKHFLAGFNREFLARWLSLFEETLNEKLSQEQASMWAVLARRMGAALASKNEYYSEMMSKEP